MNEDFKREVICLKDIYKLFLSCRKKVFFISLGSSLFILIYVLLFFPPKWEVKATFNEGSFKEQGSLFKDILEIRSFSIKGSGASGVMLSRRVLKPVIEKLGLQIKENESFWKNISNNIFCAEEKEGFCFQNVSFSSQKPKTISLKFLSPGKFIVSNKDRSFEAKTDEPFLVEGASLTLIKAPKKIKLNRTYTFTLIPLEALCSSLEKQIHISPKKENKNILGLSLKWQSGKQGANILNSLMEEYQNYLIKENDLLAKEEFFYLEKKQKELSEKLAANLDEYAAYLCQNISKKGFMTLDWEMNSLLTPHNEYLSKLFQIDLELKRLQNGEEFPSIIDDSFSGKKLQQISFDVSSLRSEKDILSLSFGKNEKLPNDILDIDQKIQKINLEISGLQKNDLEEVLNGSYGEELKALGLKKNEFLKQRSEIDLEDDELCIKKRNFDLEDLKKEKEKLLFLINNVNSGDEKIQNTFYSNWSDFSLNEKEKKEDMLRYLKGHLHLLDLKENMLKESFFSYESNEGFDLGAAKDLYMNYNLEKDKTVLFINELIHLKEKLPLESFEVSSLSLCLSDPVSSAIIAKAGQLSLEIQDQKNRTEKDIVRLKDELAVQKKFLAFHLDEMMELKKLNLSLIEAKLAKLKKVIFFNLNQKISLLNEEAKDFVASRIKNLEDEKKLLLQRTQDLRESMVDLPLRWKAEKLLQIKTEMGLNIMKSTSDLLESKTIQHHLEQLQSKPLDIAIPPLFPKKNNLFFLFILFFFVFSFLVFIFYFVKSAIMGFPVSLESLGALNQHVCGYISKKLSNLDNINFLDLETLRNICSFIDLPKNITVLINNQGADYSRALAKLLSKKGRKILLLDCDFKDQESGFLKALEKKTAKLPIHSKDGYDLLLSGGFSSFSAEIIGSKDFVNMIEELSRKYDEVILYSPVRPMFSEAKSFLKFANKIIITLKDETMEELRPYFVWNNKNDCRYLSFIAIS